MLENIRGRIKCLEKENLQQKKLAFQKKNLQSREDYETVKGNKYKTNWNRYFRKEKATWWQLR